jgi:hypothetical protein
MNASKLSMPATSRDRVTHVLRIGPQVAAPDLLVGHAEGEFLREEIVGDPHFIAVGVAGEREQRRLLRFPSKPADAAFTGRNVGDNRGASDDAVPVAIERVLARQQRVIRNRLDQAGAKQRDRRAARDDIHVGGHHRLAGMLRHRKQVHQRVARGVQRVERSGGVPVRGSRLEHQAGAADRRHVVTGRAAGRVERGPQPVLGGFDLREILEAQPEFREFCRRDPGNRVARVHGPLLSAGDQRRCNRRGRPDPEPDTDPLQGPHLRLLLADGSCTTSSPRMKWWPAPHIRVHSNT